nr:hypothetical protein CFP56_72286 [Quercus suber]
MEGLSMRWRRSSNKKIVKQRAIFTPSSCSFLPVLQQRLASELLNVLLEFQNMEVHPDAREEPNLRIGDDIIATQTVQMVTDFNDVWDAIFEATLWAIWKWRII